MIRERPRKSWKRRFAFLPITLGNGPSETMIWWQWVWVRSGGYFTEVSAVDPEVVARERSEHLSPTGSEGEAEAPGGPK